MAEEGIIKYKDRSIKYKNIKTKNDMIQQVEFSLRPLPRGFHLVTNEVMRNLPALPKTGILNLFVSHTICGLSLNENFDPDVRHDLKGISFNQVEYISSNQVGYFLAICYPEKTSSLAEGKKQEK